MPFTVEEFRDLARILEERPEWRTELRRLVLTEELLALPEQVARLRAETEQRFQDLIGQVAKLTAQVSELTTAVHELTRDVGELKGYNLERLYRERAPAYFSPLIRRAHVLSAEELSFLLDEVVESGKLSEVQADDALLADVVVRGRGRQDGAEVYLVVEVSWKVDFEDVDRAVRRAEILAKAGLPTIAVVAGKNITDGAATWARAIKVWQFVDGKAVAPEPTSENS